MSAEIQRINPLTHDQRSAAESEARNRIAGPEPKFVEPRMEDFAQKTYARYAPEVMRTINTFADIVMVAAFIPSALRIFFAGFEATTLSMGSEGLAALAAVIIGLCSVMLAEAGMIAFTLAMGVTESKALRSALFLSAIVCASFAFVGNFHVVMRHADGMRYVFTWLEALAPPALALTAANVRKNQILHSNEARYAAQQAYDRELTQRKADYAQSIDQRSRAYADAHIRPDWMRVYADCLREALWAVTRGAKREELRVFTPSQWKALVLREIGAGDWWEQAQQETAVTVAPTEAAALTQPAAQPALLRATRGTSGGAKTGVTANRVTVREDGQWVARCPRCDWELVKGNETSARNGLSSHIRYKHKEITHSETAEA